MSQNYRYGKLVFLFGQSCLIFLLICHKIDEIIKITVADLVKTIYNIQGFIDLIFFVTVKTNNSYCINIKLIYLNSFIKIKSRFLVCLFINKRFKSYKL